MLKVRVRNVLGVKSADFRLEGIVLIAGQNRAGKSSLLNAVAAVALNEPAIHGAVKKRDLPNVLREGAEAGSATLDWGAGSQRVVWPEGTLQTEGQLRSVPFGSSLGIGARLWSQCSDSERRQEFAARCDAQPTIEDLAEYLAGNGGDPAAAPALWERIETSGWDAVATAAAEASTKKKGAWSQVTKTAWGDKKAATWRPGALLPDEDYTVADTAEDLRLASEALEKLVGASAVDAAEADRLRATVAEGEAVSARHSTLTAELAELDSGVERLTRERAVLPASAETVAVSSIPCPHCHAPLRLSRSANGVPTIVADTTNEAEARKAAARMAAEIVATDDALRKARREADAKRSVLADLAVTMRAAANAQRKLDALAIAKRPPAEQVAEARLVVAKLEERLKAVDCWVKASALYQDWHRTQPMLAALKEDGCRAVKAGKAVAGFNASMAEISAAAMWGDVTLQEDLSAALNGRAFAYLSESEKWCVDTCIALTLAKLEGAAFVLVDRADVLVRTARPGLFKALWALGIPSVVACSFPDNNPGTIPALRKMGAGSAYWLQDGVLAEQE
jgi:hypothetical protein